MWLKRPIFLFIAHYRNLRAKLPLAIWVRYAPDTQPHLHTALDIDISRYEYVYRSAHVHVWICICIPWRGQTLHITAYDTMSRSGWQTLILLIRHYEAYKIYITNMDISHEISALEALAQNKALPENLRPEIRSQIRSIKGSIHVRI